MSFLLKSARLPIRNGLVAAQSTRFSTFTLLRKDATETVKDTVKSADKKISEGAVKGIEMGESAAAKVKETIGIKSGEAKGKANELAGDAKGKAHELAGQAKGKAAELKGEAKAKM